MNKRISASFTFDMVIENCKGSLSMFLADDQKIKIQKRSAQIMKAILHFSKDKPGRYMYLTSHATSYIKYM